MCRLCNFLASFVFFCPVKIREPAESAHINSEPGEYVSISEVEHAFDFDFQFMKVIPDF